MKIFPVVHIGEGEVGRGVALDQAGLAFDAGADGVYLIDHFSTNPNAEQLLGTYAALRANNPDRYIGLNILSAPNSFAALKRLDDIKEQDVTAPNALWVDNIANGGANGELLTYKSEDLFLGSVRILGGVAFKYTDSFTEDPAKAAALATRYKDTVDVVTTSGQGTGFSASPEKTQAMKRVVGSQQLAIASGIDVNNVAHFASSVDEVLASSSIETAKYSGVFDSAKLKELIAAVHDLPGTAAVN